MSLLRISSLDLTLGATKILHNVDLQVAAGETVALTGESGAGKSMVALAVMGLLPAGAQVKGGISFDGEDLLAAGEKRLCAIRGREIGMVFQEPMTALNPLHSIGDQVAETFLVHGNCTRAEARENARMVLERVGLPAQRFPPATYPHALSGGQRQRVVIAMAIALRPRLLIADEPTTALDVTTQARILDLLRGLATDFGMAMLIITHDLAVVAGIAGRIAVMRAGEVAEEGPTDRLFAAMRHPYTKSLFQASAHQPALPPAPATAGTDTPPLLDVDGALRIHVATRQGLLQPGRRIRAVDAVSFRIHAGERVGLVGESGCGKSTLARAILGLEPLQGGSIRAFGQPVGPRMDRSLRAGLQAVFQDPYGSFNPRHRVGRCICEPFHLADDPPQGDAREQALAEVLCAVGLQPEDGQKYIHEFSGGQRQRIAIARALIMRPALILFDEAVSALDVSIRARILDLIVELAHRHALGYLFISHDLGVVRGMTDRVMVMCGGTIVEEGKSDQVFTNPRHPYTRALIDAAPKLPAIGGHDDAATETAQTAHTVA